MALGVCFMLLSLCSLFGTSFQQMNERESSPCPSRWKQFQNTCYRYVEDFITWDDANTRCSDEGAILAEPDTREKFEYLTETLGWWSIWIGGSYSKTERTFVWSRSGTPIDTSLWYQGQVPDTWGRKCLVLEWSQWEEMGCAYMRPYVCEKQANV